MRPPIHPCVYLAAVAVGLLVYWSVDQPSLPNDDRDAMMGTWTDESGPPGNSIRFYHIPSDLPGVPLVKAYEGRITLVKFLGLENSAANWNYGSGNPLVLNIGVGNKAYYAAIRKVDDDHILIRFGTDAEEIYSPGAIGHPETKRLTRIGREPGP